MVKDDTLLLAGGVGLAAAFALGLFGKPEDIKIPTPTGIGFPDLSFLSDLFSFAGGVPDLGSSFFEGIAQQLAALQDQIGATGATIINIPQEFGEGVTDTLGDIGTGVSDFSRTAPPRSPSATISSPVKVGFKSFESFAAESRAGDLLKNAAGSFRFRG